MCPKPRHGRKKAPETRGLAFCRTAIPRALLVIAVRQGHRSIAPTEAPPARYAITHGCAVGWNLTPLPRLDTAPDNTVRVGTWRTGSHNLQVDTSLTRKRRKTPGMCGPMNCRTGWPCCPSLARQAGMSNTKALIARPEIYFPDSGREGLTVPTAWCKLTYSIGNVCLSRKTDLRFEDLRFETGGAKHY